MSGMDDRTLLDRHARLLFDLDADGRIAAVNEPEPDPPPRLWIARGRAALLVLVGADVRDDQAAAAEELCGPAGWDGRPAKDELLVRLGALLDGEGRPVEVMSGPAFTFGAPVDIPPVEGLIVVDATTAPLLERHFPFTRRHLGVRSPVAGVVRDGAVVAICMSCRTRPDAGEAGLFTVESARGQGFARALVPAWRTALDAAGRMPFYSTTWDNTASLAVARRLGLQPFAEEITVR